VSHKSVYFAQRNPGLGERFRPRWRRHAALAMSLPEVWDPVTRYTQCDPLRDPPAALSVTARYDGIGIAWFSSIDSFRGAAKSEAMDAMRRDELETFQAPVSELSFRCTETVLKDEGPALFKIFSVMNRADEAPTLANFPGRLVEGLATELLTDAWLSARLARLAVSVPNELSLAAEGIGRLHDALLELSFHTLDEAVAFFDLDAYASMTAAHQVVEIERCATRELLLDDRGFYD
jgi:hypothetical protein